MRSGRELNGRKEEENEEIGGELKQYSTEVAEEERTKKMQQKKKTKEGDLRKNKEFQACKPHVPFPQRLHKAKLEEKYSRFLNMFMKIEVNIPFSKALTQMHHYAKFMKDIMSRKIKIDEKGVVSLATTCSAVIQ